jgi:hypothetical protein
MITKFIAAAVVVSAFAFISPANEPNKLYESTSTFELSTSTFYSSFQENEVIAGIPGIRLIAGIPGIRLIAGIPGIRLIAGIPGIRLIAGIPGIRLQPTLSQQNQTLINETSKGVRV